MGLRDFIRKLFRPAGNRKRKTRKEQEEDEEEAEVEELVALDII
jgi:hypothetical protein